MKTHRAARHITLVPLLMCGCTFAHAETVTLKCEGNEFGKSYEMTMIYNGDSRTLKITGAFGEMTLPAAKKAREAGSADGGKINAMEIWASAEASLVVPEKAAIEACIKSKLPPDQAADPDIVFSTIPSCAAAAPPTPQPIPVKVYAEIGILDAQTIFVTFKRTYLEQTALPDGKLVLEPLPPPNCILTQ